MNPEKLNPSLSRRGFLKTAGAVGVVNLFPHSARAQGGPVSKGEVFSTLVDLTRCIGCRSCMRACKSANRLPGSQEAMDISHLDQRQELTFDIWTVVNREGKGDALRHVKQQCMHCLEPACVSVCPVAALDQTPQGPIIYRASRCIGCRYCMIACPFDVPRFEWNNGLTPVIGKCQFCAQERLFRGLNPACTESCPTGALKFGKRSDLLSEAHARIKSRPDRYVDHVFGEEEVGGTSWLYISDVPFAEVNFKKGLPKRPMPSLTWDVVSYIPALVAVLASLFGMVAYKLSKHEKDK